MRSNANWSQLANITKGYESYCRDLTVVTLKPLIDVGPPWPLYVM